MEYKWYAVYTRSHWEKKVADSLSKENIENYCPLNKVIRQWSDRRKLVEEPLFTSYVFIRVQEKQKNLVRQVYGVVNFVYWLGQPAVIPDPEIESIKDFLKKHENVQLRKLHVDDRVKIMAGPFITMEAEVVSVNKKTVKVVLPSLRFILTAEIERENLKFLPAQSLHAL